jgi:UDP-3-O-[3-hydroxymyristoyl] glucosamine N-acyltransferase
MSLKNTFTAGEIAEIIQGKVIGDASIKLSGVAAAESAEKGDLTFAESESYLKVAEQSQATAILVKHTTLGSSKLLIQVQDTRIAMAKALAVFYPAEEIPAGIHPTAIIDPTAQIDPTANVGPHCCIGKNVRIGKKTVLTASNHIGPNCSIGSQTVLHPNVVLYANSHIGDRVIIHAGSVIGSDGYGYILDHGVHRKIMQIGNVTISDDVEIGANTAIDRAALGSTVIGQGTKIDNLVHLAHNVKIGKHCLIMGQCGFAGSTELGDYCVIASQSGIADHLKLGHQSTVGAKSGVMRDIPDRGTVLGIPAVEQKQAKRQIIAIQHLPELVRKVRELEKEDKK